jgi:ATP synthase protein I
LTKNKNDERYNWARQAGLLGTIPFLLAIPPIAGVLIGRWIDEKAGSSPAFTIVFVILGFIAGIREVANVLRKANLDSKNDNKKSGNNGNDGP